MKYIHLVCTLFVKTRINIASTGAAEKPPQNQLLIEILYKQ